MMKSTLAKSLFVAMVIGIVVWPCRSASSTSDVNVYRVKRIFLQTERDYELNAQGAAALTRLHSHLRKALLNLGFVVVESAADSDAVMDGDAGEWVTLDGPQPDPPKYSYQFWLRSSKHEVNWRTKFNVASRAPQEEVERKAMEKVAHNLFNSWKKSAAKAGIVVGDKLP
jgi:hypothetical protein